MDDMGDIAFGVYMKPNQDLKYLNKASLHTPGCFKAIITGVSKHLTKLTMVNEQNGNLPFDQIYPKHFEALKQADLVSSRIPTLREKLNKMIKEAGNPELMNIKKRREKDRKRAIYFKMGFSKFWKEPIHTKLKKIRARVPSLSWIRISMSYHRFTNLRELFQGDLMKSFSMWDQKSF